MYCEKCGTLFEEGRRCPSCRSRRVREPKEGDPCYHTSLDFIWCDLLADVLAQEKIPFLKKGLLGAGVVARIGQMLEEYRFLVPYECLPRAREIVESLFSGEAEPREGEPCS